MNNMIATVTKSDAIVEAIGTHEYPSPASPSAVAGGTAAPAASFFVTRGSGFDFAGLRLSAGSGVSAPPFWFLIGACFFPFGTASPSSFFFFFSVAANDGSGAMDTAAIATKVVAGVIRITPADASTDREPRGSNKATASTCVMRP